MRVIVPAEDTADDSPGPNLAAVTRSLVWMEKSFMEAANQCGELHAENQSLREQVEALQGKYDQMAATMGPYYMACAALLSRSTTKDLIPAAEIRELEEVTGASVRVLEGRAQRMLFHSALVYVRDVDPSAMTEVEDMYRLVLHAVARRLCKENDRPIPDSIQPKDANQQESEEAQP